MGLQSELTPQHLCCFRACFRTAQRVVTVFRKRDLLSWYLTGALPSKNVTFQFGCRALSSVVQHMHYQHHSGCIALLLPLELLASCFGFDLKRVSFTLKVHEQLACLAVLLSGLFSFLADLWTTC